MNKVQKKEEESPEEICTGSLYYYYMYKAFFSVANKFMAAVENIFFQFH